MPPVILTETAPGTPRDKAWIAARIPHAGAMCLLDRVVSWTAEAIRCETATHADADNPLRAGGRLAVVCGIEYAAQAMAAHGALLADLTVTATATATATAVQRPRAGYLAAIRRVQAHTDRLDTWPTPLRVEATRVSGDGNVVLYDFAILAREPARTVGEESGTTATHEGPHEGADTAGGWRCLLSGRATVMLSMPA